MQPRRASFLQRDATSKELTNFPQEMAWTIKQMIIEIDTSDTCLAKVLWNYETEKIILFFLKASREKNVFHRLKLNRYLEDKSAYGRLGAGASFWFKAKISGRIFHLRVVRLLRAFSLRLNYAMRIAHWAW